jgi:hypothetical protein
VGFLGFLVIALGAAVGILLAALAGRTIVQIVAWRRGRRLWTATRRDRQHVPPLGVKYQPRHVRLLHKWDGQESVQYSWSGPPALVDEEAVARRH